MGRDRFFVPAQGAGTDFTPVKAGVHTAVLAAIIYLEDQPGYMGGPPRDQLLTVWLTPDLHDNNGRMKQIRHYIGWPDDPLHEKAGFRKLLEQWRGRPLTKKEKDGFHLNDIIGEPANLVTIVTTSQNNRQYAKLTAAAPAPEDFDASDVDFSNEKITAPKGADVLSMDGVDIVVQKAGGGEQRSFSGQAPPTQTALDDEDVPF